MSSHFTENPLYWAYFFAIIILRFMKPTNFSEEIILKYVGRTLKYLFIALLVVCNGALILRVCVANDESVLNKLAINDTLRRSYAASSDTFAVKKYAVGEKMTQNGEFSAYNFLYIPSAWQLQITVRINDSVMESIAAPSMDDFTFALRDDNDVLYAPSYRETSEKYMYHYIQLVFNDIDLPEWDESLLFADDVMQLDLVALLGADQTQFAEIIIYDSQMEPDTYKLSASEQKQLEN